MGLLDEFLGLRFVDAGQATSSATVKPKPCLSSRSPTPTLAEPCVVGHLDVLLAGDEFEGAQIAGGIGDREQLLRIGTGANPPISLGTDKTTSTLLSSVRPLPSRPPVALP